jgi:hypothetical protein
LRKNEEKLRENEERKRKKKLGKKKSKKHRENKIIKKIKIKEKRGERDTLL